MKAAELAQEATRLLLLVRAGDEQAVEAYDRLLYEPLLEHVARRGHLLVSDASRLTGTDQIGVPFVGLADLEEVAHDVAVEALRAARQSVHQFQPGRGDGAAWAFRAASFAYVDVVRTRSGSRRKLQQVPTDQDELVAACDASAQDAGPDVRYEMQEALDRALSALEQDERKALLLKKQFGFGYAEIAQMLYDDRHAARRVDQLVNGALRKIRRAEKRYRDERADG